MIHLRVYREVVGGREDLERGVIFMVSDKDFRLLRERLERLREQLLGGGIEDRSLWLLLQDTSTLLDLSRGGKFEKSLEVIYDLLFTVWRTRHNQHWLARMKQEAEGLDQ